MNLLAPGLKLGSFAHADEPHHQKICLMLYANNKGADQPAHLLSTFVVPCLDSVKQASAAEQADLGITWSETRRLHIVFVMWLQLFTIFPMQGDE